jgi:hypothetical protein
MIVFVHQPEYMPWLGFFDKLARCDTFVIYDDAQYQHGGFHNRNKIRTLKGWEWITVPIIHGHPQIIKNVRIAGKEWKNKHLNAIKRDYEKAPYFKDIFPLIVEAVNFDHELLIDLNMHLIENIANALDINVSMVRSSQIPYGGIEKNEKLVSMCKFLGANTYLSGSGGATYLDKERFAQANINVKYHNYEHPTYTQKYNSFEPNMSIIDLLFNAGSDASDILLKGGIISSSFNPIEEIMPPINLVLEPVNTTK